MEQISYAQFEIVDMRVGRVIRAEEFPKARKPAYKLWIDFGELGVKTSSAQITRLYRPEELVGRMIVAVTNFPPRRVADFASEVLVLGVEQSPGEIALLAPDRDVQPGLRVF